MTNLQVHKAGYMVLAISCASCNGLCRPSFTTWKFITLRVVINIGFLAEQDVTLTNDTSNLRVKHHRVLSYITSRILNQPSSLFKTLYWPT